MKSTEYEREVISNLLCSSTIPSMNFGSETGYPIYSFISGQSQARFLDLIPASLSEALNLDSPKYKP